MSQDSTRVVVGANGQIYIGPTDATAPDAFDDSLDSGFFEVGFVSEDGATITDSKDIENIGAWQALYPIRRIITAREFKVAFAMREWSGENIMFAFGGGTIDTAIGGGVQYTPPEPEVIDERAFVLDWQDDDKNYRLYIPRGMATAATEATLTRTAAADLAIEFSALSEGTSAPYTLFTNDPAFTVTS